MAPQRNYANIFNSKLKMKVGNKFNTVLKNANSILGLFTLERICTLAASFQRSQYSVP